MSETVMDNLKKLTPAYIIAFYASCELFLVAFRLVVVDVFSINTVLAYILFSLIAVIICGGALWLIFHMEISGQGRHGDKGATIASMVFSVFYILTAYFVLFGIKPLDLLRGILGILIWLLPFLLSARKKRAWFWFSLRTDTGVDYPVNLFNEDTWQQLGDGTPIFFKPEIISELQSQRGLSLNITSPPTPTASGQIHLPTPGTDIIEYTLYNDYIRSTLIEIKKLLIHEYYSPVIWYFRNYNIKVSDIP